MTKGGSPGAGAKRPDASERHASRTAAALDVFETIRDELNELLRDVREGESAQAKRLAPMITELARAVGRMADEGDRLNGGRGRGDSEPNDWALDLDAARREVCRRLADIRASG